MRILAVTTLFLTVGCAAPEGGTTGSLALATDAQEAPEPIAPEEDAGPIQPTPWTDAFMQSAVLMADTILVEGPPGLFEHAVTRADNALFLRKVETIPAGRRQSVRPRETDKTLQVVRAQLDAWQLAAFREVVFLERVDPSAPIRVIARGDAVWRDTDGNESRQGELVFQGELTPQQSTPTETTESTD